MEEPKIINWELAKKSKRFMISLGVLVFLAIVGAGSILFALL